MADVRSRTGTPVEADFGNSNGTPIVIDTSTSATYAFTSNTVTEIGQRAGWQDLLSSFSAGKAVGVNAPTWATFRSGIGAYSFSASTMNELWLSFHISHDYAPGTRIYPHIHWSTTGTNTGVCRWGIEYSFARGYSADAFPASTTLYLEQAASGTAYTHHIVETNEAASLLLDWETDGILMARVFRDAANGNDTLTDAAFGLFMDLHYQSDGMLTNERNRTFTKKRGQL